MSIYEIQLQGYIQSSNSEANGIVLSTILFVASLSFLASYM